MPHLITENLPFTVRRGWTVDEFEKLFETGFFPPDARLELIEGEVFEKISQNEPHAHAILLAQYRLLQIFASGYLVRIQIPLILGESSKPEPDVAVARGSLRDDENILRPTTVELVVEISDSTLVSDQTTKAALYARAQIAEYWIVNLVNSTLEVRCQPSPMAGELLGWGYRSTQILLSGESIAPLGAPSQNIGVDELLP